MRSSHNPQIHRTAYSPPVMCNDKLTVSGAHGQLIGGGCFAAAVITLAKPEVTTMVNEISQHVTELQNNLIFAGHNYTIWWLYKNKESRKKWVEPLTLYYPTFISTSFRAHFIAMIMTSYKVLETRRDTINFHNLIKLIEKEGIVCKDDIKRFRVEIERIKQVWIKIAVLRNNVFGHKSNTHKTDTIWKQANITPHNFKSFIEDSKKLLNDITQKRNNSGHLFSMSVLDETKSLFDDLNEICKDRL